MASAGSDAALELALDLLQVEGGPWRTSDVARHRLELAARYASPAELGAARRRLLGDLLICNAEPASPELLDAVDAALANESGEGGGGSGSGSGGGPRPTAGPIALPGALRLRGPGVSGTEVAVWRGDITSLRVDAVTNAANEAGLGCFQPGHRCIDNVLHRAAGPRMREACRRAMAERAAAAAQVAAHHSQQPRSYRGPAAEDGGDAMRDDGAGEALPGAPLLPPPPPPPAMLVAGSPPIVTAGFRLPAAHVLHVTGPHLAFRGAVPTPLEASQLASVYSHCLDACAALGLRSVAFCCVSTGLFNYPGDAAARCALAMVHAWLAQPEHAGKLDLVVFDVFTEEDARLYLTLAPVVFATA